MRRIGSISLIETWNLKQRWERPSNSSLNREIRIILIIGLIAFQFFSIPFYSSLSSMKSPILLDYATTNSLPKNLREPLVNVKGASGSSLDDGLYNPNNLYLELINAELSFNSSHIHNAFLDANPYVMAGIDWNEPIFDGCSLFLQYSNHINDWGFIDAGDLDSKKIFGSTSHYYDSSFVGLLYFDHSKISCSFDWAWKSVLENLREYWNLDFQILSVQDGTNASFIYILGHPEYSVQLSVDTFQKGLNLLNDEGIFGYLNELGSDFVNPTSIATKYFGQSLFILDNWNILSQIQEDLDSAYQKNNTFQYCDLIGAATMNPIYQTLSDLMAVHINSDDIKENENLSVFFDSSLLPSDTDISTVETILTEMDRVVMFDFVFEGTEAGFMPLDPTSDLSTANYSYNLFTNLGLNIKSDSDLWSFPAHPDCFNNPLGWLSGISISLKNIELTEISTSYFSFSEKNLVPIDFFLLLMGNEPMVQDLFDYYLYPSFLGNDLSRDISQNLMLWPEKYQNINSDDSELAGYLLPTALPTLSSILLDEIPNIQLNLSMGSYIPKVILRKTLNPSANPNWVAGKGDLSNYNCLNDPLITLTNQNYSINETNLEIGMDLVNLGSSPIWGVELDFLEAYGISNEAPATPISMALEDLGFDLPSMFSQEIPRAFFFDPFGSGMFTETSLNLTSLGDINPYSQEYVDMILSHVTELLSMTSHDEAYILEYALRYNKTSSIFNSMNWKIEPHCCFRMKYNTSLTITFPYDLNNTEHNSSIEILNSAQCKFRTENSLTTFVVRSNSLVVVKNQLNNSEQYNANGVLSYNISQGIALRTNISISSLENEEIIPNTSSYFTVNFNCSIENVGLVVLDNITLLLPALGVVSHSNFPFLCSSLNSRPLVALNITPILPNTTLSNITISYKVFLASRFSLLQQNHLLPWGGDFQMHLITQPFLLWKIPEFYIHLNEMAGENDLDGITDSENLNDFVLLKGSQEFEQGMASSTICNTFLLNWDYQISNGIDQNSISRATINNGLSLSVTEISDIEVMEELLYCNISFSAFNRNPFSLTNLELPLDLFSGYISGINVLNDSSACCIVEEVLPFDIINFTLSIAMNLTESYLVPPIHLNFDHNEFFLSTSSQVQVPIIPDLSFTRTFSASYVLKGGSLSITLSLENNGDFIFSTVKIYDRCTTQDPNLVLVSGTSHKSLINLGSGDQVEYLYSLKFLNIDQYDLSGAVAEYWFVSHQVLTTSTISIFVFPSIFSILSGIIVGGVIIIFLVMKKKHLTIKDIGNRLRRNT